MGFFDSFGDAVIGAAAGLGSAFINSAAAASANSSNLAAVNATNQANLKLNRENREFNRALWYEQQKYNSPVNQMRRFLEAGLNPHLVYQQGNNGNAGSPPQSSAPTMIAPHFDPVRFELDDVLNSFLATKRNIADVKRSEAMAEQAIQNAEYVKTRNILLEKTMNDLILGNQYKTENLRNMYLLTGKRVTMQELQNDWASKFGEEMTRYKLDNLIKQNKNLKLTGDGLQLLNDLREGQKTLQGLDITNYMLNHGGSFRIGNVSVPVGAIRNLWEKFIGLFSFGN